jgi:hypothetical protein
MIWLLAGCTFSPGQGFSELAGLSVHSQLPSSWTTDLGYVIALDTATLTVGPLALVAHAPEEEEEEGHAHAEEEPEEPEEPEGEHADEFELVWVEGSTHDWLAGGSVNEGPILPSPVLPRAEIAEATLQLGQLSATGTVSAGPRTGPLTLTLTLDLELLGELELAVDEEAPEAVVVQGTLVPGTAWLDGLDFQEMTGGAVINPTSPEAGPIVEAFSQMPLELQWTEAQAP